MRTTIKSSVTKISLALSPCRDKYPLAATAEMAILIVAVFPSRLSRYKIASDSRRDVKVGRANSTNAEPVDPAIRTTHMCHRIVFECVFLTGT